MSQALQFTQVFDPANPPKKMQLGGSKMSTTPVAASKALEARGIKTQAIKDLETPPPVSVADNDPILVPPPQLERLPFRPRFDDATPMFPMEYGIKQEVDPSNLERMRELGMILQAQNDQSGINAVVDNTPIARLKRMDYNGIV